MTVSASWREDAACRSADPDLFFPVGTTGAALRQAEEAKRLCRSCSARIPCLTWALDNDVTDGVWGGTTEAERRVIRSSPRRTTNSKAASNDTSYHSSKHGEHGIRAEAAQPEATWILRRAGIGRDACGPGAVATSAARDQRGQEPTTGKPAPLVTAQDANRTVVGYLALLAEAEPAGSHDTRTGYGWRGGFARDFATVDGQRIMVAALTRQQFADLAKATRLATTFSFLERVLSADFSTCGDLHTYRGAIAALLAPWVSRRTVAELAVAFAGTSVPWAHLHNLTGRSGSRR